MSIRDEGKNQQGLYSFVESDLARIAIYFQHIFDSTEQAKNVQYMWRRKIPGYH